jgi:hypothetical protein
VQHSGGPHSNSCHQHTHPARRHKIQDTSRSARCHRCRTSSYAPARACATVASWAPARLHALTKSSAMDSGALCRAFLSMLSTMLCKAGVVSAEAPEVPQVPGAPQAPGSGEGLLFVLVAGPGALRRGHTWRVRSSNNQRCAWRRAYAVARWCVRVWTGGFVAIPGAQCWW